MERRCKLYDRAAWKRLRLEQLRREPWCAFCLRSGHQVPAQVVDHVIPHRGDEQLFFDPDNLASLCKQHHDATKQKFEKTGVMVGGDIHGIPFDTNHHWAKE